VKYLATFKPDKNDFGWVEQAQDFEIAEHAGQWLGNLAAQAAEAGVGASMFVQIKEPGLHVYYPEMGEQPDRSKLFQRAQHIGRFTFVDWSPARDAEARAVFKRLGVRPAVERVEVAGGGHKFTARMSSLAWQRVRDEGDVSAEALL
jgi:hypothetical protein